MPQNDAIFYGMATLTHRLVWCGEVRNGILRIVRQQHTPGYGWYLHRHEFQEVFWIESGAGSHLVNGQCRNLTTGDVVCIRPEDAHSAQAGSSGMTVVNASFHPDSVVSLATRHAEAWPWRAGPVEPLHRHVPARMMERLQAWVQELGAAHTDQLALEAFVLDLVRMLAEDCQYAEPLPRWLAEALEAMRDPVHLAGGTVALSRLARRAPAHVNRVLRRHTGKTATEVVTAMRLDWAEAELRLGNRAIPEIVEQIGLSNLGHFYTVFFDRFSTTPAHYRTLSRQFGDDA